MSVKVLMDSPERFMQKHGLEEGGTIQQIIDNEILKLCEPYVPRDNGDLIKSGELNTVIGSGKIVYNTPYARKWYYVPAEFQGAPKRGNYWFERMKNEGGADRILRIIAVKSGGKL